MSELSKLVQNLNRIIEELTSVRKALAASFPAAAMQTHVVCPDCNGKGVYQITRSDPILGEGGYTEYAARCSRCGGTGSIAVDRNGL
jgi:DnaJ-class molecular chaperone